MSIIRSPWEADRAGLGAVYADDSVLDQMLLGCAEVYWEIQSLQDYGVAVIRAASLLPASTVDHAVLREAVQTACGLAAERRPLADTGSRPAALWSVTDTDHRRIVVASEAGLDVYEPQIVYQAARDLTGGQALELAKRIGAIDAHTTPPIDRNAPLRTSQPPAGVS